MFQSVPALFTLALAAISSTTVLAQNKPTFPVTDLPNTWEKGQTGTNQCGQYKPSNQKSMCQNAFINSVTDFCVWGPPRRSTIGEDEALVVSYCTQSGYGTRLIPDGTLKGAHFIKTPDFVQVTGYGDFTKIHVQAKDQGGELDPHGADGYGNPKGGLVYSRNVKGQEGQWVQIKEWANFMSATEFSFRACYGANATSFCPHTLDEMGSRFNHPGNYKKGSFDNCDANSGHFPAVFKGSTFYQGAKHTPKGHKPGASSNCVPVATVSNQLASPTPYRRRSYPVRASQEEA
jgi:hypothetical protein